METGYTEYQKMKILYEESLREIHELKAQLEGIAEKIVSAASSMNKAETTEFSKVSAEIGGLVGAIERQQQRVETFSDEVQNAIESATKIRVGVHGLHEKFLEGQVNTIVSCVSDIKSLKEPIVKEATDAICEPLVKKLTGHYEKLVDFEKSAAKFMGEIKDLQMRIAVDQKKSNAMKTYSWLVAFVVVALAFAAGHFLR